MTPGSSTHLDRTPKSSLGACDPSNLRAERALESSLYLPVNRFLEKLGFEVKGEVCGCDLVALDGKEPTAVVIGELKLTFTLDLVLQAVDRTAACDEVWLAVRASRRGRGREHDPRVRKLCRLLGLGLLSAVGERQGGCAGRAGAVASTARCQAPLPGSSRSTGGGTAIPPWAAARASRS